MSDVVMIVHTSVTADKIAKMPINIKSIRDQFPILKQQIYGKPLIYLDSAASAHKVVDVLLAERRLTLEYYGNIHRAAHYMADKATADFEAVRTQVADFLGAGSRDEIIFTKGTTESINLVAFSFGEAFIHPGDEIIVTEMEHHANIVPWQLMAQRRQAHIVMLPVDDNGELRMDLLPALISDKTKLIAVTHVSNVLGTINPIKEITALAHTRGVKVLVDGAQAVQHLPVNVQELDADFYTFSAHKIYGPNGVGVLYGKKELLNTMPPYQGGGEMIAEVRFDGTTFNELPYKFEAGTPHITGVAGLGAALAFVTQTGIQEIARHEQELLQYATEMLNSLDGIRIYGNSDQKSGVLSFNISEIHPYDAGMLLDKMGIAVRTGHHCADPIMQHFKVPGTIRISFGIYNTREEIDQFIDALKKVIKILGK
jgi:cysteine desulfurase / selenocysteine lyase